MSTPVDNLLEIKNLHTHFFTDEGVVKAVDGVDLAIPRGKTLCVVGESGCGKSVMARSILQVVDRPGRIVEGDILFKPGAGETINLAALDPHSREIRAIRGKDITMIFQEPMSSLSPLYTIGNQIMEAIRWHLPVSKQEARQMTIGALRKVGIPRPDERVDSYTFELSGGMRQRAMIAMALVCEPKLLIADEPTTALDVTTQANILDLIRELQAQMGMSVMFITHDLGVVAEIADEVAVMYLGTVVERGTVQEVFSDPKHPYTRALLRSIPKLSLRNKARLDAIRGMVPHPLNRPGGCSFHTRCNFAQAGICDVIVPPAFTLESGRQVRCLIYDDKQPVSFESFTAADDVQEAIQQPTISDDVMLKVNDLKMHFPITAGFFNRVVGQVKAVDGVSFEIYEGETLGLVGESGCGKTTLGHSIMRLYNPTAGTMTYSKEDGSTVNLAKLSMRDLKHYHREIRMVFQDSYSSLNPRMPVLDIVGESLKVNKLAQGKDLEKQVRDLLGRVGLRPEYIRRYPHAFSGGERQRIGIARALAPNPRLVVADEPVSALDVSVQAQILNLLKDLQAEFGLTYLFIAHDLSVVAHISDRVAVMYVGKIVEYAPTEELFLHPQHPYTEALLSSVLIPDPHARHENRIRLEGDVADPANPPSGCAFHPRCRYAQDRCRTETPQLRETRSGHVTACHYAEELALAGVTVQDNSMPTESI
ncbi:MAG: dipeptide ABC transporter ATP-binding protein [Anaerolineae bacterium]|nr:dipeptide ABC transporter ATP-binding protein [Anaerolineae bacterium]